MVKTRLRCFCSRLPHLRICQLFQINFNLQNAVFGTPSVYPSACQMEIKATTSNRSSLPPLPQMPPAPTAVLLQPEAVWLRPASPPL
uniref:Uncharacterized protein n=1 Tax=Globodera pallida TaxID=36090 RepID=A0A183C297_GLOPA